MGVVAMKKIVLLVLLLCFGFADFAVSEDFKWVRVQFKCKEPDAQEKWDIDLKGDETFLEHLERYSTLKVDKKVYSITLEKLDEMIKYPILFMTASGTPDLSETEIKNLKEYLNRGGFLLCDESNWPARGGILFADGMRKIFNSMYPKSKVVPLELEHELFTAHFDMPLGYFQKLSFTGEEKSVSGIWAMSDDKGRAMVFFTMLLQNTWGGKYWRPEKQGDAVKMATNVIMYSLTH